MARAINSFPVPVSPVINTVVSVFWHPKPGTPLEFALHQPHWSLWLGIVAVGMGAALVLYSKELSEAASAGKPAPRPAGALPEAAK